METRAGAQETGAGVSAPLLPWESTLQALAGAKSAESPERSAGRLIISMLLIGTAHERRVPVSKVKAGSC